ncbi:outer membrane protein assembly factor BamD [Neisseria chenwenguii]|uniref:Outer membrane protein assembly factor BamD n=1 Tax=Neisseria chenwenguii TaxID=1853278 RepID=A0A220RZI6_9NEIS|nr:outer membrane protein assembly factor BamD [Neisseria chenwenguii]ASK26583.1 outer membrane protein assembly factor BamD [Neisseria chenwenguii]ROV55404.1 outer membrane protein assembly factor BamD [Neisseria chenwenguii]
MKKILLVVSLSLALGACAGTKGAADKDAQITQDWSVDKLYKEAQDELNSNNYTRAVKLYEILESRFPDGRYAQQAQLDTAYAYYKDDEPEKALAAIERFQRQYPQHPNTDYALYLKGLVLFNEDKSFLNKLASQDWSDRDPKANRDAYQSFAQLVQQYPDSKYAADATERMTRLVDALGGNEMAVARYYMKRGAYLAAVNRAQKIVERYQNTRYVEESLAMMELAYQKMGKQQLAGDTRRILAQNFPKSPFLTHPWQPNDMPWWRYWK